MVEEAVEGIGPGVTARCVVRDQSGFADRIFRRKAVPVVWAGVDREHGNRNGGVLLHAEGERGPNRRAQRQWGHVHDFRIALMKNGLELCDGRFELQ